MVARGVGSFNPIEGLGPHLATDQANDLVNGRMHEHDLLGILPRGNVPVLDDPMRPSPVRGEGGTQVA